MQLALDKGFSIEVICFTFRNWSYDINNKMMESFREQQVKFHCIEAGREGRTGWLISGLKEKYHRLIGKTFKISGRSLANAISRRNYLLLQAVKKIKKADWVIGHNPGALYATKMAAKKLKAKSGFDVEDYHPGEGHNTFLQGLTRRLMQKVLPAMDYVSFAAPLIREAVKEDLGKEGYNWITVLNYFPAAEFMAPKNIDGPLKLVWFSQNISAGRGLEYLLPILKKFVGEIELHLFGNMDKTFYDAHLKGLDNVIIHEPLAQKELHHELINYDVGLALEPKKDLNNDLAISNKLLAYSQAGLFVLASHTQAQKKYLEKNQGKGVRVDILNRIKVEEVFNEIIQNIQILRLNKIKRFKAAEPINWETVSTSLINEWKSN